MSYSKISGVSLEAERTWLSEKKLYVWYYVYLGKVFQKSNTVWLQLHRLQSRTRI